MNDCNHCWHDTGVILTSDPPYGVEVCCHCGDTRHLRIAVFVPPGTHGPYAPFNSPVGGVRFIDQEEKKDGH